MSQIPVPMNGQDVYDTAINSQTGYQDANAAPMVDSNLGLVGATALAEDPAVDNGQTDKLAALQAQLASLKARKSEVNS